MNDNLVLVVGKSGTGKSMCLKGLDNPEGVMYLNCENSKRLPFPHKFKHVTVVDPLDIPDYFEQAEEMDDIHTIVVDSLTFMMDMYETIHVNTAPNTLKAWGQYGNFLRSLMQDQVTNSTKNVIFTAHTGNEVNEDSIQEVVVKVKGSLMDKGIEAFFCQVVACKRVPLKNLTYENPMLDITNEDKRKKHKYVFQTDITEKTINERIRGPYGMWAEEEVYIDNNIQYVLNRIQEYYGDDDA